MAPKKEEFWALRDVSVNVHRGEVLGIIGPIGPKNTRVKGVDDNSDIAAYDRCDRDIICDLNSRS
jgi:hypothetical protein